MKYSFLILAVTLLSISCQQEQTLESEFTKGIQDSPKASTLTWMADSSLRVLDLHGSPYDRGFQHGQLLKQDIRAVTDSLLIDIGKTTQMDAMQYIDSFLAQSDFTSALEKWTPELLEEIKGISAGSEIPYPIILMHQLGDEFFFSTKYMFAHKCSSIGVNHTDSHPTIAAQNMDIPTYFHGYQTVMKINEKDGREKLILTIPGHIGITGMNSSSISINCNILMQLEAQSKGMPVSGIVRGTLNHTEYDQALNWVKSIDHASGQNYLIGGKEKVVSLECSAQSKEEFKPFADAPFTYHTNYPVANKSYSDWYLSALDENGYTLKDMPQFCWRFPSFQKRFNQTTADFGIAEIKEVLSSRDHEKPDVVSNTYTYASVIYVLDDQPQFIIAPGKPHETEYINIPFPSQSL
ncbi:hypothetical protein KFE98_14650 [bacterium SCSIO 12741]|nr:hypothetical protein KFE98_14650 [bacterium SCSIO 12741]